MWLFFLKKNKNYKFCLLAVVLFIFLGLGVYFYSENKWQKAENYYRQGEYKQAAKEIAYLLPPKDQEKLKMYAHIMFATGELDKAEKAYSILAKQTDNPFFHIMLGNVYREKKEFGQAVSQYEELIDSHPNYVQAYLNLASLYSLQGQQDKAVEVLKRGTDKNPNAVNLYEMIVSILSDNKESSDYRWAKSHLKKLDPNNNLLQNEKES